MNSKEIFLNDFSKLVEGSKKILITSHMGPDDDSISSVLGIYWYLTEHLGKESVEIAYSGNISKRWEYFKGFEKIKYGEDITTNLSQYDLVIALDGAQYARFTNEVEAFKAANIKKICIDHHVSSPDAFDLLFVDSNATSTAEMIYDLFYKEMQSISKDLCELLLLGILGDTGTFRYIKPTQIQVFEVVKRLLQEGNIDIQLLKSRYEGFVAESFDSVQEFVKNAQIVKIDGVPNFLVSYVDYDFIEAKQLDHGLLSEAKAFFVDNFSRSFKGVRWGMVLYPAGDKVSVSMRALPESANVRLLCEALAAKYQGNGGGHDRASAVKLPNSEKNISVKEYLDLIVEYIKSNGVTLQ